MKFNTAISFLIFISISITACTQGDTNTKINLDKILNQGEVSTDYGISYSGQPTEAQFKVFANSGYKTVIDIKGVKEERGLDESSVVDALGMKYINFPIEGDDAINFDNASKLDRLIASSEGPVLLHCGSSNRVGALITLIESEKGLDNAAALKVGKDAGLTRLKKRVQEVLKTKR